MIAVPSVGGYLPAAETAKRPTSNTMILFSNSTETTTVTQVQWSNDTAQLGGVFR